MIILLHLLLLLASFSFDAYATLSDHNAIKKIRSFFHRNMLEKVDHKELSAASLQSISIDNNSGPITIKTGWKKDHVCLTIIKRAHKQHDLDALKIIADATKSHHLSLATKSTTHKIKGSVEYELIVPTSLNIKLSTQKGDIFISDIEGSITAHTSNGNIIINNTHNIINAHCAQQGNITINNAHGKITTSAQYGTIAIAHAYNTIDAHSEKGKITVDYTTLPDASSVNLSTTTGNICLALPSSANASFNGSTDYGTLLSDMYITLNPYTTQLNSAAWNKFKKEVNGVIGSGDAHITLVSTYGSIKITENKTS